MFVNLGRNNFTGKAIKHFPKTLSWFTVWQHGNFTTILGFNNHIQFQPPSTEIETLLPEAVCLHTSSMMLQWGQEYGFGNDNEQAQTTQLQL